MRRDPDMPPSSATFGGIALRSHFQPIYSLPLQRPVGYEGLLRGTAPCGAMVSPFDLFAKALVEGTTGALDRMSHATHLERAASWLPERTWLFVNVTPASFIDEGYAQHLAACARDAGVAPEAIVIELLESDSSDIALFAEASAAFREQGFLVAVDDFGAGHSNLDRLLTLQPDIVKLDRSLVRADQPDIRDALMPKLVGLLHEAGMLVVAEGIETEADLLLAARSGVDFVQGFLFGQPQPEPSGTDCARRQIETVFDTLAHTRQTSQLAIDLLLMPYRTRVAEAAERMLSGMEADRACADLLQLPCATTCFFLDDTGRECIPAMDAAGTRPPLARFAPLSDPSSGRWDNRPYFVDAIAQPQHLAVSAPYLSAMGTTLCVTISIAFAYRGNPIVLGLDLDWSRLSAPAANLMPASAERLG
jgi:EAL domain-containing protein (putative c-di-GMP-specific phosphodiesterase class I)